MYTGRTAELYDLVYEDKPYKQEVDFLIRQMSREGRTSGLKILDLACGTGSHAVELARRGHCVIGLDLSSDMIAIAAKKKRQARVPVIFAVGDMTQLPFSDSAKFDVCVCLFDSIGFVQTNDRIVQTMAGVRNALNSDGAFIFEFWHAPAMIRDYEPYRVRTSRTDHGELLRISHTRLDIASQTAEVAHTLLELRDDGTFDRHDALHTNRFFLVQEMSQLLGTSGFEALAWYGGFREVPVNERAWHVVCCARPMRPD